MGTTSIGRATVGLLSSLAFATSFAAGESEGRSSPVASAESTVQRIVFQVRDLDLFDGQPAGFEFFDNIYLVTPFYTKVLFDNEIAAEEEGVFVDIQAARRGADDVLSGIVSSSFVEPPIVQSQIEILGDVFGVRRDTQVRTESGHPANTIIDSALRILPNTELKVSFELQSQISYSTLPVDEAIVYAISRVEFLLPWGQLAGLEEHRSVADACHGSIVWPDRGRYDCGSFVGASNRDFFELSSEFVVRTGDAVVTYGHFLVTAEVGYHTFMSAVPEPSAGAFVAIGLLLLNLKTKRKPVAG